MISEVHLYTVICIVENEHLGKESYCANLSEKLNITRETTIMRLQYLERLNLITSKKVKKNNKRLYFVHESFKQVIDQYISLRSSQLSLYNRTKKLLTKEEEVDK